MNDEIRAEAQRQLDALRRTHGHAPHPLHSLGYIFPPTPGLPLPDGEGLHLIPMTLEEWAAEPEDASTLPPMRPFSSPPGRRRRSSTTQADSVDDDDDDDIAKRTPLAPRPPRATAGSVVG